MRTAGAPADGSGGYRHDVDWLNKFSAAVRGQLEIQSVHRGTGDLDYLVVALVPIIDNQRPCR